jgi:hypothetical protein
MFSGVIVIDVPSRQRLSRVAATVQRKSAKRFILDNQITPEISQKFESERRDSSAGIANRTKLRLPKRNLRRRRVELSQHASNSLIA